jgi:hypothetical protein
MTHPNKPRLKDGNEREPPAGRKVAISFRPPNSYVHMVSDGENWQSLGKRYRVAPTKIVQDNFRTNVPEEINWYLNHYVDCDTPTPDRYNWRFSSSARRGTSPRAGIVYVVPDWPPIFLEVKKATVALVRDWFSMAGMQNGQVIGPMLVIPPGSVSAHSPMAQVFTRELEEAGAPTSLAEAISEVLRDALSRFTASVSANQSAFPTLSGPVRPGPKPPLVPWPLLAPSALDGFVKASQLRGRMIQRMGTDAAAGTTAVNDFTQWFERSFQTFRMGTIVTNVEVQLVPTPQGFGIAHGTAFGVPGMFLTAGGMPLV